VLSQGIQGLLLHSATTPVALQRGIYIFLLPLRWERQQGNGVLSLGKILGVSCFSRNDAYRVDVNQA
jgi:hypothetical protein